MSFVIMTRIAERQSGHYTEAFDTFESVGRPPAEADCMNLIVILILSALIFEFVLHRLSEALNLRLD
jgi:hypothetical protein